MRNCSITQYIIYNSSFSIYSNYVIRETLRHQLLTWCDYKHAVWSYSYLSTECTHLAFHHCTFSRELVHLHPLESWGHPPDQSGSHLSLQANSRCFLLGKAATSSSPRLEEITQQSAKIEQNKQTIIGCTVLITCTFWKHMHTLLVEWFHNTNICQESAQERRIYIYICN